MQLQSANNGRASLASIFNVRLNPKGHLTAYDDPLTVRRCVHHVLQNVNEYWIHCRRYGWMAVSKEQADEWPRNEVDFVELRHTMPLRKGVYGPLVFG